MSDKGGNMFDPDFSPVEADNIERENEMLDEQRAAELDPHFYDFSPGYATEMDFMNANEADDYAHEFDDIDF
jgi:hypothetical protein